MVDAGLVDEDRGINVKVLADTPPTHLDPEPGTFALAGIGLGMVFVRRWRKRHVQKHNKEVCR